MELNKINTQAKASTTKTISYFYFYSQTLDEFIT